MGLLQALKGVFGGKKEIQNQEQNVPENVTDNLEPDTTTEEPSESNEQED
jgi:hypothetical protein